MMHHHQNAYAQHQYQHQMMQPQHQQQQMIHLQHHQPQHQQQQQQQQPQQQQQQMQSPPMVKLGKRPIAPAPLSTDQLNRVSSTINNSKKAKLTYAHMAFAQTQPASVQRRNARERNRVKQVNMGFANLRQHIPSDVVTNLSNGGRGASKKLSKVDTLRMAVEYIRRLQGMLDENELDVLSASTSSTISSVSNNSYYSSSPVQCTSLPPPSCSESSASPTPSYSSDNSSIGGSGGTGPTTNFTVQTQVYEYPVFGGYNPEEEELLDAISYWQQQ